MVCNPMSLSKKIKAIFLINIIIFSLPIIGCSQLTKKHDMEKTQQISPNLLTLVAVNFRRPVAFASKETLEKFYEPIREERLKKAE